MPVSAFRPARQDLRALLRLAGPLVAVQVGQMTMNVVDTLVVGQLGDAPLAAAALGNIYSMALTLTGMGALLVLDPLIAQAVGARDEAAASLALQRGVVLATLVAIPVCALHVPAEAFFVLLGQQPEAIPGAAGFTRASILGILPFLLLTVMRQALQARHLVRPILIAMVAANAVNLLFNWVFVYGNLGAPALGAAGSGLATSLSRWFLALLLAALAWPLLRPQIVPWRRDAFDASALRGMLAVGAPIALQLALEIGAFNASGLLIGTLGVSELAAHTAALNLASYTFMVPLGVGMAASVLVGNAVGRGAAEDARRAAGAGLVCGASFMAGSAVVFLTCAPLLAGAYVDETETLRLAASLVAIAGVFQVFDGVQCVATGILRGAGESRIPAAANLLGYWVIGLPVGWWLVKGAGLGPGGLWWGLTLGLAAVAVLLTWRTFHVLSRTVARLTVDR